MFELYVSFLLLCLFAGLGIGGAIEYIKKGVRNDDEKK